MQQLQHIHAVLWIRDIFVRIRILLFSSVTFKMPTKKKQFYNVFFFFFFSRYFYIIIQKKVINEVTKHQKSMFSLGSRSGSVQIIVGSITLHTCISFCLCSYQLTSLKFQTALIMANFSFLYRHPSVIFSRSFNPYPG